MQKKMFAGAVLAMAFIPAFALADTGSDVQSQIQALLAQIQSLQQQIQALMASSSSSGTWMASSTYPLPPSPGMGGVPGGMMPPGQIACVTLDRNLGPGSQGPDVRSLQQMLSLDPSTGFTAQPTGFFGPLTAQAVIRFQQRNGIPPAPSGNVGPLTRGFLDRRCGPSAMGGAAPRPGMLVFGTVSNMNGSSFTVQRGDSSQSTTVNITASTTIQVFTTDPSNPIKSGSASDIVNGVTVQATGYPAGDGSMNASMINVGTPPVPPGATASSTGY